MSLQDRLRAGAASFSHLAGIGRTPAAARQAADDDGDDNDRRDDDDDSGARRSRRAEEDDGDDDRKDDDDDDTSARRSRRAADDDDDGDDDGDDDSDRDEMRGRSAVARARARERGRCAAIFASPHAARNPALAAELAFNTTQSRREALGVLAAAGRAAGSSERSRRNPDLGPGGERNATSSEAIQAGWDRAFGKVTGSRR